MKRIALTIIVQIAILANLSAQNVQKTEYKISSEIAQKYNRIIKLIKGDKSHDLSKLIVYPLKMQNPLPDIQTPEQFVSNYTMLFDAAFKKKLQHYRDTIIFEHNGAYGLVGGLFDGDLWMNDDGKLTGINYDSKQQIQKRSQLTKHIQSQTYLTVNSWKRNIIVGKSDKLLIRVDLMSNNSIRYVSWSKGKSIADKPDLILLNGKEEAQGTMGGWTWTFKSGDWIYIVDDVEMCEDNKPQNCGLFLRLSYKGIDKSSIRLKEIK
ncbi:MAG: hypothetical protein ABIN91_20620 [Mucilaginibacter sp.]|uniref:hypothetical protein n=1 Tax=Mucilaginibacter sp. TaxID=1882438 RepID=UPI003263026C